MNLPQMREWAASHHSEPVRQNVNSLCDAIEALLEANRIQARSAQVMGQFATVRKVWVVTAQGGDWCRVIGVLLREEDCAPYARQWIAAEKKAEQIRTYTYATQEDETDTRPDYLVEWDEHGIQGIIISPFPPTRPDEGYEEPTGG